MVVLSLCAKGQLSDLVALKSALEFNLAEVVVEGLLGRVPAAQLEEGAQAKVQVKGLEAAPVDDLVRDD